MYRGKQCEPINDSYLKGFGLKLYWFLNYHYFNKTILFKTFVNVIMFRGKYERQFSKMIENEEFYFSFYFFLMPHVTNNHI